MKKQYLTGNKAVDARRKAAQKMRTKKYKENPNDPTLYTPLPGDEKAPKRRSKYADG
jgi:hypothetical protein